MKNTRYYVECCGGRQNAKLSGRDPFVVRYRDERYEVPVGPLAPVMGRCVVCLGTAALVTISVKARFGGVAPKCDGRCLNGKTSCDCQCNGRCHGAGECRCAA